LFLNDPPAFQKRPRWPVRCESIICGAFILTYVQVHTNRSSVTRNDGRESPAAKEVEPGEDG